MLEFRLQDVLSLNYNTMTAVPELTGRRSSTPCFVPIYAHVLHVTDVDRRSPMTADYD